jgi:hypothetical protein
MMNRAALNPAQRDIWAAQRLAAQPAHHLCRVLDIVGADEPGGLQAAAHRLVATWPALRLGVEDQAGQPNPFLLPDVSVSVRVDQVPRDGDRMELTCQAMAEPFRLNSPPLLRIRLLQGLRDGVAITTLVVVAHHLVVDGVGFNRLVTQLVLDQRVRRRCRAILAGTRRAHPARRPAPPARSDHRRP